MPNMLKVIFVILTICASVCGRVFNQSLSDDKDVPKVCGVSPYGTN